jgi:NAD+-dependent protein deacetylase sirtuin 4
VSDLATLVELLRGRTVVALTGAGCSTESGIPDYRSPERLPPRRAPIQHRDFLEQEPVRRRYWARSLIGWPRFSAAVPNEAHRALAALEDAEVLGGIITQNVDGLHQRAGSRVVVELHGALSRVRCLQCGAHLDRELVQRELLASNPGFAAVAASVAAAPDGDADLPDELVATFRLVACATCAGVLMPDVVFFGGNVSRATLDIAWSVFARGEVLLVIGSSLTVFSGYRFVYRAAERAIPVAIINRGPTRGDPHATICLDARAGSALPALERALRDV